MLPSNVDRHEAFERSFDFSNFPNLQEVIFGVHWERGGQPWIPTAFTTLGHATSPRLSTIRLLIFSLRPAKTLIKDAGNDLRRVADEVARIKREFGEGVDFAMYRDMGFKAVLDTLNVRFRCCGLHRVVSSILPHRSSRIIAIVEMGTDPLRPSHSSLPIGLFVALTYSVMYGLNNSYTGTRLYSVHAKTTISTLP